MLFYFKRNPIMLSEKMPKIKLVFGNMQVAKIFNFDKIAETF